MTPEEEMLALEERERIHAQWVEYARTIVANLVPGDIVVDSGGINFLVLRRSPRDYWNSIRWEVMDIQSGWKHPHFDSIYKSDKVYRDGELFWSFDTDQNFKYEP